MADRDVSNSGLASSASGQLLPLHRRTLRPRWDVAVAALLVLLVAYGLGTESTFGNTLNVSFLLGNTTTIAIVALPMTLLVAAGEVDLSVGSMAGLSGALMGALWNANWPIQLIIPVCLLVGLAGGLLNGLLVTRLGLPSLAVTIGTLALFRGVAQIVLGANAVSDFPQSYLDFGTGRIGGTAIPDIFVLYLVLLAVAAIVLHATAFGRRLFAIGANPEAAFFAGVRVKRTKLIMFAMTGLVSGGAGVIWALHYTSARYDNATGLELSVIAAVLLGGIDFDGGRGTIGGAVAGVFLLGTVQNLLSLKSVSADSQTIVTGLLLIASVLGPRAGRQIAEAFRRRRARPAAAGSP
ncbi:MAG TPA: ABC transporter permease [Actinocrinis sp.]|nr:ABC transporter permease [Actinocrinis sp.]HXR74062.1 ABC transporter permease [Actinocrinis sp.]